MGLDLHKPRHWDWDKKIKYKNMNEIKKALYKQKPTARLAYTIGGVFVYNTVVVIEDSEIIVTFRVPPEEMGEKSFQEKEPAQLLIRWIIGY